MQPANAERTAHDLSPAATPGRVRLPRFLMPLPWLAALACAGLTVDAGLSLIRIHKLDTLEAHTRTALETAEARAAELRESLRVVQEDASLAASVANWAASGCHMQGFLLDTLEALPPGLPANRMSLNFQDASQQAEVILDLGGSPETALGALARAEAAWTAGRIRVSARDSAGADGRRHVHRLTIILPLPKGTS
jgi:hypothetical protein